MPHSNLLNIAFLIDITNSMSDKIQALKSVISETITLAGEIGKEAQFEINFELIPFYENEHGTICEAPFYELSCVSETRQLVSQLHTWYGGYEENVKHAIATFNENNDFNYPTIMFLITDQGYHKDTEYSNSANKEREVLQRMNYPTNLFKIWEMIPKRKLFFYPMIFDGNK